MIKLTKSKIFLIVCLAFVAGVGLRSFTGVPIVILFVAGASGFSLALLVGQNRRVKLAGLCLLFFILGIGRYELSIPQVNKNSVQYYNNQEIRLFGIVDAEPDLRQDHVKLTIKAVQGILGAPEQLTGKLLVKTYLYPEYRYGDLLDITCRLQSPEPIEFDTKKGPRVFSYDKYLARFDIYTVCYRPKIELTGRNYGNVIMAGLLGMKRQFLTAVQKSLPEPQASFLGGLILGAKKSIPDDLMENFNQTGTTHIIALSGYNITIIAVLVMNFCKHLWISRKKSFWVSLGAISFFVLITGAQASVVRAGIMGMLVLLATQLGRLSRITNALVLAAVVMLLINPRVLVFDAGFQLSFLATIGLVYLSPIIEKYFKKLPLMFEIRQNLTATLSAIIFTAPLVLFQFGRFSLVAPLVNILILPAIPMAMGLGFMTGILALTWTLLGQVFGWVVWAILSYIIFIVEIFAKLNFASFTIRQINWLWLVLGYSFLGFVLYKKTVFHRKTV